MTARGRRQRTMQISVTEEIASFVKRRTSCTVRIRRVSLFFSLFSNPPRARNFDLARWWNISWLFFPLLQIYAREIFLDACEKAWFPGRFVFDRAPRRINTRQPVCTFDVYVGSHRRTSTGVKTYASLSSWLRLCPLVRARK